MALITIKIVGHRSKTTAATSTETRLNTIREIGAFETPHPGSRRVSSQLEDA